MKKVFFTGLLLLPMFFAFSPPSPSLENCACDPVSNIVKTAQGQASATYTWDGVDGATGYKVWYVRDGYTSLVYSTTNTTYEFTGLASGAYTFYFKTVCGTEGSSAVGVEDLLQL